MKKIITMVMLIITICYSHTLFATAYSVDSVPNIYKNGQLIYVSNPDQIISADDENKINQLLNDFDYKTDIELVVVALESIGEQDSRQFANELFNHWKIGKAGKDNGLLILLVVDQREVVFETGYGLEGILPDVVTYRLQQQYMVPDLRDNNFSQGLLSGVIGTINYVVDSSASSLINDNHTTLSDNDKITLVLKTIATYSIAMFLTAIAIVIIMPRVWLNRDPKKLLTRTKIWGLIVACLAFLVVNPILAFLFIVFFYIIFFHFYLSGLKKKTIQCKSCNSYHIQRLKENDISAHLNKKEHFEVKIKSVKYLLSQCLDCGNITKIARRSDKYHHCPSCDTYAAKRKSVTTLKAATYTNTGLGQQEIVCEYCHQANVIKFVIPRKIKSTSTSSSHSRSSLSSRSSSGSSRSRGGGSSGGGGSRSRF